MRSRILLPIALAVAALAGSAAPAQAVEVGVNQVPGQAMPAGSTAAGLGAGWVRLWGSWQDAQPAPGTWHPDHLRFMNEAVADARSHGLKVLMIIHRSPAWASGGRGGSAPPTDPSTFGAAMGEFAKRVPGVDAWELWNEEDESTFFAGGADPQKYAAMVKSGYRAIKAVQPSDVVVTGATTGNNYDFIASLYKHGIKDHFDAVAVHTDTACLDKAPDFTYREPDGRIGRFTFTGYREVHSVMQRNGDGAKPIWMTELGWNTQDDSPNSCSTGKWAGQKPLGVNEALQAQYLAEAYGCLASDPYVQVAFWFGMQDIPNNSFAGGYGLFRRNGSAKPSAGAFAALAGGIAPRPCGGVIDTSGPEIVVNGPADGLKFTREMGIDVKATDSAGGVGIRGIELRIDGRFYRYFGDGHALMPVLWDSRVWSFGRHTLTFVAEDEAGNKSSRSLTVVKVRKLPKARTAATVAVAAVDATTVLVTGEVTSPRARAAAVRGKVFVVFQRLVGARTWKTIHRVRRGAGRAVSVKQRLAPGHWRVRLVYPGRKGFKRSRSAPVEFDIAPVAAPPVAAPPVA